VITSKTTAVSQQKPPEADSKNSGDAKKDS
jgi:hypothetical protein